MDRYFLLQNNVPLNDDNLETFGLVWIDSTCDEFQNQDTNKKLRSLLYYLKTFKTVNQGQQYIEQRSKDDRLVLVVTGQFGKEIVPKIHQLRQISSIYVFCGKKDAHKEWSREFTKIRAVVTLCKELIDTIEIDKEIQMKINMPLSIQIFNPVIGEDMINRKTNKKFIYFQLFLNYLCKIKLTENDEENFINLLKDKYRTNNTQLEFLDNFQKTYVSDKVLSWYTPQSLFHQILSKALNTENIPMIIHFRELISDLYYKLKQQQQLESSLKVFRTQFLANDELDYLKENLGQLISINSFWYANIDPMKVINDINEFKASEELHRVLFAIDIGPESTTNKPFALFNAQDESDDPSDVLFMASSIFHLSDITEQDDRMWIIKMILCTDQKYNRILVSRPIKTENESDEENLRIFAKILWKMDHLDLSHRYYSRLVNELSSNDPLLKFIYEDFAKMALEKKDYETAVEWYRKAIAIKNENPSKTFIDSFPDIDVITHRHACQKSDRCDKLNDEAHTRVYFHVLPCRYGSLCGKIDDVGHNQSYTHPEFCNEGGLCIDMSEYHLLRYRHVPLCKNGLKCSLHLKHDIEHCKNERHCKPNCKLGAFCFNFHNSEHMENENHPFKPPCPYTPYMCHFYDHISEDSEQFTSVHSGSCRFHCQKYSHVCPRGRQCTELSNREHTQYYIHIMRLECPQKENCQLLNDQDHLNSYSHSSIKDIRSLCSHPQKKCPDRLNSEHIKQFRHTGRLDHFGVSRYLGLNKNINFIRNHNEMFENIQKYIQESNWTPKTLIIPDELKRWICALRPVHRCNKETFESILVHGHVMSREHMNSLREPTSVAKAVKNHAEVKRILNQIENPRAQQDIEEYIRILVEKEFKAANSDMQITPNEIQSRLAEIESILRGYISIEDRDKIQKWTRDISKASFQLYSNQTGIGFAADQVLGTNKHVFSVLGPHRGHYYGDIFFVFSRELMFHPDSNFSIQAATTFGQSQNAYKWRPWLKNPGSDEARIEHFHRNKLNCSIEGYEEAAAAELLALTALRKEESTTNIDLNEIKKRWLTVDSHLVFEAHLPQLIPLDYTERVYISQSTFNSLSSISQELSRKIFGSALCISPHEIDLNIKLAGLKGTLDPARTLYQSAVVDDIFQLIETESNYVQFKQGTWVTISASRFKEYILNPMTISQSFQQTQSTHNSIYIYWEAYNGDMMLTLTNQIINPKVIDQADLQCLTCYITKWPSNNILKAKKETIHEYHEDSTYISIHHPNKHYYIIHDKNFKASSNTFHRGCNIDDYIMYCLHIDRITQTVTLSICGSNSIHNHEKISYQFNSTELDLNQLEFIQISAGLHTVPVRNLIIRHEPMEQFHPMIDIDSTKSQTSLSCLADKFKTTLKPQPSIKKPSNLCPDSVHCRLQYAKTEEGKEHIEKYMHPCRFSEKCRNQLVERHLVHIPHRVPTCDQDKNCSQLSDPLHRAQFRHSNYPDYLVPCNHQQNCREKRIEHKIKYSHGETIPLPSFEDISND